MEQMLDQGTKDYLNEKFNSTNEKLDKVISTVDRIDGKVVEHDVRLSLVEKSHSDHVKEHKTLEGKKSFRAEMWVIIIIFLADKIFPYLERLA